MADSEQIPPKPEGSEDAGDQGGVFGNLPGSRPGRRSPRRGEPGRTADAGGTAKAASRASRSPAQPQRGIPRSPQDRGTAPSGRPAKAKPATPPPADVERGGVEDLAWAGIAVAAEAATLGVRLLSRAVDSVRKPDRR